MDEIVEIHRFKDCLIVTFSDEVWSTRSFRYLIVNGVRKRISFVHGIKKSVSIEWPENDDDENIDIQIEFEDSQNSEGL